MGWCSGTEVFDLVYKSYLDLSIVDTVKLVKMVEELIKILDENDWDCHSDSIYWNDAVVVQARHNINPELVDMDFVRFVQIEKRYKTGKLLQTDIDSLYELTKKALDK